MKREVREGMTAYDLGAHMGYFTLVLAKLVGVSGQVFAFEPDPRNLDALMGNLTDNDVTNVTVTPAAVADLCGEVSFATFPFSSVSHITDSRTPADAVKVTVPALTLDAFVYGDGNPPPDFIKIDVEGAEARVIRGASQVLREAAPVVILEAWRSHWTEVEALMSDLDYRPIVLRGESELIRAGVADVVFVPARRADRLSSWSSTG